MSLKHLNDRRWAWLSTVISWLALGMSPSWAQSITLDGTLGPQGTVSGPEYIIQQTIGRRVGNNLFHSFGRFNLNAGESATFNSSTDVRNILSRVTGGELSTIDGLIKTQRGNVNFFLINPTGVVFGPNARLEIGNATRGSFVATTMDALVWPDGRQFSAVNPGNGDSLLTLRGDPSGFLAAQRSPAPIASKDNTLGVYADQSLLLVGGEIQLDRSRLTVRSGSDLKYSKGGRIELLSLAQPGTVGLILAGDQMTLNVPSDLLRSDISLANGSQISVVAGNGGEMVITARNLNVLDSSALLAGIGPNLGSPEAQAGNILIRASETVTFDGTQTATVPFRTTAFSPSGSYIYPNGQGQAGDVDITTKNLVIRNAQIGSTVLGNGKAGNIIVRAAESVVVSGEFFNGRRNPQQPGERDRAPSGLFAQVNRTGTGQGGTIDIQTDRLRVSDGGRIQVATFGRGSAGNLIIRANQIDVFETATPNFYSTAINGGAREIFAGGGGQQATGAGGIVDIQTDRLRINGGSVTVSTLGTVNPGTLTIRANQVEVSDNPADPVHRSGEISANVGAGAIVQGTGSLTIATRKLTVRDGGKISATNASTGKAGDLTIRTSEFVTLRRGGQISTDATGGGDGGNINIQTPFLISGPFENTDITANATQGRGGTVDVSAQPFWFTVRSREDLARLRPQDLNPAKLPTNDISAISQQSPTLNGTVIIRSPDADPAQGMATLPSYLDDENRIAQGCAAQGASSFSVVGRGLPVSPMESLAEMTVLTPWIVSSATPQSSGHPDTKLNRSDRPTPPALVEASHWTRDAAGQVVLVADRTIPTNAMDCAMNP